MCGGFTCSKNSLLALNILYIIVAFIMIGVAAVAKVASIVTSLSLVSGIIACAVFLLFISIVGLIGASKHHQVMLFFYMIVLFIIFIIQFSVACACLAINEDQQSMVAARGWNKSGESIQKDTQNLFGCCGYTYTSKEWNITIENEHPSCVKIDKCCPKPNTTAEQCCTNVEVGCGCSSCDVPVKEIMFRGFNLVGGIGLFFSFTEVIGFLIAKRYRHEVDPRANIESLLR